VVTATTGSARNAIASVVVFFVLGGILLSLVDVDRARAAKDTWSFDAETAG
jgi:MFS-type transporter involved in bile tolerance (Atg22 family)